MYNKDQPRVPKGNPNGGQWVKAEAFEAAVEKYSSPSEYERIKLDLQFFAKKSKEGKKEISDKDIPTPPKEAYGFLNKERLHTKHHVNHSKEMGFKDQDDYERAAIDFWERGEGKVYASKLYPKFYKYDKKSKSLLTISYAGIIHTFMKRTEHDFSKIMIQERLYVPQNMLYMRN